MKKARETNTRRICGIISRGEGFYQAVGQGGAQGEGEHEGLLSLPAAKHAEQAVQAFYSDVVFLPERFCLGSVKRLKIVGQNDVRAGNHRGGKNRSIFRVGSER